MFGHVTVSVMARIAESATRCRAPQALVLSLTQAAPARPCR